MSTITDVYLLLCQSPLTNLNEKTIIMHIPRRFSCHESYRQLSEIGDGAKENQLFRKLRLIRQARHWLCRKGGPSPVKWYRILLDPYYLLPEAVVIPGLADN